MVALGTLVYSVLVSVWMHRFSQCKANPGKLFHTGHFKGFIVGRRLTDTLITKIPGIDFRNCTRECSIRKRCRSINFLSRFPLCEINHGDISENGAVVVKDPDAVYTEKTYWANEEMTHESCNGITCLDLNSKCQENMKSLDTACVPSDCGDIPEIPNATAEPSDGIGVFSKATYTCGIYYEAVGDRDKISCLPEGTWSTTTFQLSDPKTGRNKRNGSLQDSPWRFPYQRDLRHGHGGRGMDSASCKIGKQFELQYENMERVQGWIRSCRFRLLDRKQIYPPADKTQPP